MKRISFILFFLLLNPAVYVAQEQPPDSVEKSLLQALSHDSADYSANYRLGMHYYDLAVKKVMEIPYDTDMLTLDMMQNESVDLFRRALPYLEKAYHLNPSKKEVLNGLSALYFSLNELDKAEKLMNPDAGAHPPDE